MEGDLEHVSDHERGEDDVPGTSSKLGVDSDLP